MRIFLNDLTNFMGQNQYNIRIPTCLNQFLGNLSHVFISATDDIILQTDIILLHKQIKLN